MNILVTGGTVFASRYTAEYFAAKGHSVYVLNRGSKPQSTGVKLICADRHSLGSELRSLNFDAVIDVTSYNGTDVSDLLDGLALHRLGVANGGIDLALDFNHGGSSFHKNTGRQADPLHPPRRGIWIPHSRLPPGASPAEEACSAGRLQTSMTWQPGRNASPLNCPKEECQFYATMTA